MTHFLRRHGGLLAMVAIVLIFWALLPETFMTAQNLLNISQQIAIVLVVAIVMTVVMVLGDFDLSVGAMASLAGVFAAVLFTLGVPIWAALLATLALHPRHEHRGGWPHKLGAGGWWGRKYYVLSSPGWAPH